MPSYGRVEQFKVENDDWISYMEQLEFYFEANDVTTDEKKRAILLSVCGSEVYRIARNLMQPVKLSDTDYKDLVKAKSATMQRAKFNMAMRKSGHSVSDFICELNSIAEHCDFGVQLGRMIADRLLVGLNHQRIQTRLMDEKELTYTKALKLLTSMWEKSSKPYQRRMQRPL